ncbi:MAG TPA: beta-ketoacyl synthase N-terminal-like domain-containing protein [Flavobacterium sp.]|nr:beta-ketoacyl synthase N-terminal-like domain-containing protein [Flavobacterium sp.]
MSLPVSIVSLGSFSPLGSTPNEVWESYLNKGSLIRNKVIGDKPVAVSSLTAQQISDVQSLRESDAKYKFLDDSVLYAILASRSAVKQAGWKVPSVFGINIGSSRGATGLFEQHHAEFITTGKSAVQSSPATTLGNISSWVAQDLTSAGPDISHSITCSTALHALLNGVAWLRSGMADKFLIGGSEAPLTPFTIAQMQAMKIYSHIEGDYPCRAMDLGKTANTMVLGEGAASVCLEIGKVPNAIAYIDGVGYATEMLQHSASISANADCLQRSMQMALEGIDPKDIDAIVMHAPGTIKGDLSEYNAIRKVFGNELPLLTGNKWKIGHTFGSSGLLSLELAILMIKHNRFIGEPFMDGQHDLQRPIKKVLVNAVGFGGNAVSVVAGI